MRFLLLALLFWVAPAFAVLDCDRLPPDDLYEYKENYVPQEFSPEPFALEITDLLVLSGVLAIGGWLSVTKKPANRLTLLMALALAYFGFIRGGCICPVGATTNFCFGLAAPELIGKVVAILFLLPLIAAFFAGRIFCSSACPLGAVQHLLARRKGYLHLPQKLNSVLRLLPIAVLAATAWGALRSGIFVACKLDAYKILFFTGHAWFKQMVAFFSDTLAEPQIILVGDAMAWITLLIALALGVIIPRPFCRFACPYGVLLGIFSIAGFRRRKIDKQSCLNCTLCSTACPVQAIDQRKNRTQISNYHCIQCGRCDEACTRNGIS